MLQIKVGVQLASLKLPLAQALLAARELGAEAVEIDARHELRPEDLSHTGVRQVRKMLDDLNLRVSAVSYRTRRGYHVVDDLDARIDATKRALRLAYDLGTNVVVNHIGRVPPEGDAAATGTLVQALADIGRYSQKVGAFLAAETGTESGADLARLIGRLPPGSIGVDLNPAQLVMNGHSPAEAVRALGPHIMHVHASDATRDLSFGRGIEVQLGRGSAEFPELLAVLEEHQYRGYITIERRDANNPRLEIGQALEFFEELVTCQCPSNRASRLPTVILLVSLLALSWFWMQAVHELGHVLGAWLTGGSVDRVVLHPLTISRTDVGRNPHPLVVAWAGPIVGVLLPLATWGVLAAARVPLAWLARFFAGFCCIANGLYLGVGSIDRIGDAGDIMHFGSPIWALWLFGVVVAPAGLALWNGLETKFGWGKSSETVSWLIVLGCAGLLLTTIVLASLLSSR